MFKGRTLLLLTLSIVFAVGAAFYANSWLKQQLPGSNTAVAAEGQPVVYAAMDIPYGQPIERRHLKIQLLPEDLVPANSVADPAEIEGMIPTQDILVGDVIRRQRLSEHQEGATLAALIDPEKRAFTVRVNDVVGVAGFLLPGNHVDVIATKNEGGGVKARTVLKDIKVLAVDQKARTDKNDPIVVRAVTLELTPKESEELAKARDEGRIQLTLRNPMSEEVATPTIEPAPAPAPVAQAEPPKKQKTRTYSAPPSVIVIKGVEWERKQVPM
ncbi:Flp pilus assembly protein RcpC/CpaB [Marinobacterium lacunae]|uniref:Flp pilus assembly protein RcpC/CpaB n=1 Tax=Marinobacterium lacunae TaxID=1232683 RepID=A0A081G425_9GAMM|nr:Flp pilus assembly protein CpaB [Marinobacterium lacunae]KEA65530.1 Flp pilus assembly protein RcpC/CpaB [Marinobacterium lacunae]